MMSSAQQCRNDELASELSTNQMSEQQRVGSDAGATGARAGRPERADGVRSPRSQLATRGSRLVAHRTLWRQNQVIALHALCLLLATLPAGLCQNPNATSTTTTAATAATTTTTTTSASTLAPVSISSTAEASTTQATSARAVQDAVSLASTTLAPIAEHIEPTQPALNASQTHKLKPVNFTLVDELFEAALDDEELARRWRNMDGQFQEGIRNILKLVFPQIVAVSQDAKVSGHCSGGILKWILSLRNLRSWAIKMLDATGKPTSGIFEGSLTMFGNYRQCLAIRAPDEDEIEITDQFEEYFRGQFCVLHMRPWLGQKRPFYNLNSSVESLLRKNYKYYEKTLYDELAEIAIAFNFIDIRMDLCVPSTCTVSDIQRVADLLSRKLEMRAKVMRCDIEPRESRLMQNIELVTLYWLITPLSLIALTLLASLLVVFGLCKRPRVGPAGLRVRLGQLVESISVQAAMRDLFAARSLATINSSNQSDRMSPRAQALTKPLPLSGLTNLFVLWFVIVQLTIELNYQYLRESLVLRNMMLNYWPLQVLINTTMIYESLILIAAFTFSYCNLESNICQMASYILQKYFRLVGVITTLIGITIITPNLALSSPVWKNFVERQAEVCKSTGYLNLFFLQNFISFDKVCLPHTWLLCVEFQLIIITLPLVLLLKKTFIHHEDSIIIGLQDQQLDKAIGKRSMCLLKSTLMNLLCKSKASLIGLLFLLIGLSINFTLVYTNQLPPAWFNTFPDSQQKSFYFSKYLSKAWTHLVPFVIGLYGGHLCRATIQLSESVRAGQVREEANALASITPNQLEKNHSKWADSLLKLTSIASLMAIIFSTFNWSTSELPTPLVAALFDSFSRLIWSLALVGLIIKLCLPSASGKLHESTLSRVFAHPLSQVLARLSLSAYLVAPYLHTLILALQEQSLFPSLYLIFHVILGNTVIIYLIATLLVVLIEQPIRLALRQLISPRANRCAPQANNANGTHASQFCSPNGTTTTSTSAASLAG